MSEELCRCGSGRAFRRCHGLRGRERRGRGKELQALAELHAIAILFPFIRPAEAAIGVYAEHVARSIGENVREATPDEAAAGVRLLDEAERARLIGSFAERHPDRWGVVRAAVGDDAAAANAFVTSAVRAAIADRVPCPARQVATLEELDELSPAPALALALAPQPVWSYEEVYTDDPVVTPAHLARLRRQARRLAARLPYAGSPRASALLGEACARVTDDAFAATVAYLLLDVYDDVIAARNAAEGVRN